MPTTRTIRARAAAPRVIRLLLSAVATFSAAVAARGQGDASGMPSGLLHRARATLERAAQTERDWIWIHALEAWVELGEHEKARRLVLPRLPELERSANRIGAWRVLAATEASAEERARWIQRIEEVFLDSAAADRLQAVESLGKLGHNPSGPVLAAARARRVTQPEYEGLFLLWPSILAGDMGAMTQLVGSLQSPEVGVRRRAAFILRRLRPEAPWVRASLRRALADETPGSIAQTYLLSAALSLDLEPQQRGAWAAALEKRLPESVGGVCLEICQALRGVLGPADVSRLAPLLSHADGDARIGAAWVIVHVLAPSRGADR